MGDTLITVVAIMLAAVLMFVFPLMSVSERNDDVAQLSVSTTTSEFVDEIRTTGQLTLSDYEAFLSTIATTGNSYDVELELKILDENPGVKTTQVQTDKIGENVYYVKYTTQILEELGNLQRMSLKEGDIISVRVKNTNTTISQILRNFFYRIAGNDTYQIAAEHAGVVVVNGSK